MKKPDKLPQTSIDFFEFLQCKTINSKTALDLRNSQLAFLKQLITQGFTNFLSPHKLTEKQKIDKQIAAHLKNIQLGHYNNNPESFSKEQQLLYNTLHQSSSSDAEKIFGEFLIGLTRYYFGIPLLLDFLEETKSKLNSSSLSNLNLLEIKKDTQLANKLDFFKSINKIAACGGKMLDGLLYHFNQPSDNYWLFAEQYFNQHPTIKKLAETLVSLHYTPNNRKFLGLAQILHWHGFGGNGELFIEHHEVSNLLAQAMHYHGHQKKAAHFQKHMQSVARMRSNLVEYSTSIITAVLLHTCPDSNIIIKDLCSGPKFSASAAIIDKLIDEGKRGILDASDIDGGNLLTLCEYHSTHKKPGLFIRDIFYEDLNLPLTNCKQNNQYDLLQLGLGVHQLAQDRITPLFTELARQVKPGGFICNPDVGELAYLQLFIVPINIVDREGGVPSYNQYKLSELYIKQNDTNLVRVVYPLHQLCCKKAEDFRPRYELGLYLFNIFQVIEIESNLFDQLNTLWQAGSYQAADELLNDKSNYKVVALQTHVLKETKEQGWE